MSDDLEPLTTDPNGWLFADVETRSWEDVTVHGAYRNMAKGRITVFTYALGDGPVNDWVLEDWTPGRKLDWRDAPADLLAAFAEVQAGRKWVVAWNSNYEFNAFTRGMIGLENFRVEWMVDAMVQASRSHLPADLMGAAKAIGGVQKQTAGKALIRLFADESGTATPQSHPVEWAQFRSYARDDVAAMRDVFFATMPLHRRMWEEYWASERINHRGVPVDLTFVRGAAALAKRLADTANADVDRLTKGKVRTIKQTAALLNWIRYELRALPEADRTLTREIQQEENDDGEQVAVAKYSLSRGNVEALIAYLERVDTEQGLTDGETDVLDLLEVRLFGASATPAKFQKILDTVDTDGRLKGQYVYGGAAATIRFSSKGVQTHNMSRDTVGGRDDELDAIELITRKGADAYDEIKTRWGYVGKVLSRLIRPTFIASKGKAFAWCDLSSIEAVVCPWLTDDEDAEPLLDAIRANHRDPSLPDMYKVCAGKILCKPALDVTKAERQSHGKTVQLACIAEGQPVLTNIGLVPIELVTRGMRVWDGEAWVSHQGSIYKGVRDVWEYQGLVATDNHIVWTEEKGETSFGDAARNGLRLVISGSGGSPIRQDGYRVTGASLHGSGGCESLCASAVSRVRDARMAQLRKHDQGAAGALFFWMPDAATWMACVSHGCCAQTLHGHFRQTLGFLRRSWNRVSIRFSGVWRPMGDGQSWGRKVDVLGSYRQRWSLRTGQSQMGDYGAAAAQSAKHGDTGRLGVPAVGVAIHTFDGKDLPASWVDKGCNTTAGSPDCGREGGTLATYRGKARVYDLLNCGPRNRFTVSGKLVHNCQFLGGKGSLFNMGRIYRVHFEDDEAQTMIDRWRSENAWAMRFGSKVWEGVLWCMENPGEPRQAGRITMLYDAEYLHGTLFAVLPNGDPLLYTGLRWREVTSKDKESGEEKTEMRLTVRKGRGVSPLWKGEFVNNFTQATAAALLRRALWKLEREGRLTVVMHTHDEIVVECDEGGVHDVSGALMAAMKDVPDWAPGLPIAAESTVADYYTKTSEG